MRLYISIWYEKKKIRECKREEKIILELFILSLARYPILPYYFITLINFLYSYLLSWNFFLIAKREKKNICHIYYVDRVIFHITMVYQIRIMEMENENIKRNTSNSVICDVSKRILHFCIFLKLHEILNEKRTTRFIC